MAGSELLPPPAGEVLGPRQIDLDRCVHCGLCLNACPTYRELGVEMDSPRGRIYQMVQVAEGRMEVTESYIRHIELCLACRGCETACPSGVQYGRLVEDARAQIEKVRQRRWWEAWGRWFVFRRLLVSRRLLALAGMGFLLYERSGMRALARRLGMLKALGLSEVEELAPGAQWPFFTRQIGKTFPAEGRRRYRVAFLAGCIANVSFARLNEATVRVLQKNGCEVVIPQGQGCCGALHVHSGLKGEAQRLARRNIDVVLGGEYDAVITNAAGCGSTLKEYHHLLEGDAAYHEKAEQFVRRMRDVTEFLAEVGLAEAPGAVKEVVTYQDSCHLAHGQKIKKAPRQLLKAIPELEVREMMGADLCCGSAGIYNVVENEMAMALLKRKMEAVNATGATLVVTANPGCMLQLAAGVRKHGRGQRVLHVVELLDEAYRVVKQGAGSGAERR